MRNVLCRILLWVVTSLAGMAGAQAAVVDILRSQDYRAPGDGLITLDTRSGRQWLDLSASTGHSFLDMIGPANDCFPTCTTGEFRGWTFADEAGVIGLFRNVGLVDAAGAHVSFNPFSAGGLDFLQFVQTLGVTFTACANFCWHPGDPIPQQMEGLSDYMAEGITHTLIDEGSGQLFVATADALWGALGQGSADVNAPGILGSSGGANTLLLPIDFQSPNVGVWLFRVPEPATPVLLTLGLFLLAAGRQGRRARPARRPSSPPA